MDFGSSTGSPPGPQFPENNNNTSKNYQKARNNKTANEWARKVGYDDAETLKKDFVNDGVKFNMLKDKDTGEIVLEAIRSGVKVPTGLYLY